MQRQTPTAIRGVALAAAAALGLGACAAARADAPYQVQVIARSGEMVGDARIPANWGFQVGDLDDAGRLAFVAGNRDSGALFQLVDGRFTPIAAGSRGTWPDSLRILLPVRMNARGNLVFATEARPGSVLERGTFLWDLASRRVMTIAERGLPGTLGLEFVQGGYFSPVLNNRDEIVFPAGVPNDAGETAFGLFFRGPTGFLQAIVVPDQTLPGVARIGDALLPSIDDAGRVAFLTLPKEEGERLPNGAFLWEAGTIREVAISGERAPSGETIATLGAVHVNNANRSLLLLAHLTDARQGPKGLYRFANNRLTTLVAPGQEMPGGGRLRDIPSFGQGISWPNTAGQHAFYATLQDGTRAAYRLGADGTLALIVKEGAVTNAGTITRIAPEATPALPGQPSLTFSHGIALNGRGQVVLTVQIGGGPQSMVLLTPQR